MHASYFGKAKALAAGILHCKAPATSNHVEELLGKTVRLELDASRGDGSAVVPFLCQLLCGCARVRASERVCLCVAFLKKVQ